MRLSNQVVVASDGSRFSSKNVRLATEELVKSLGSMVSGKTLGVARVNGFEIPVRRRGNFWYQIGDGYRYNAHAYYIFR